MERYGTRVDDDGVLSVKGTDGWVAVGSFEAILDELGETYEIEYDDEVAMVPWLDTDEDGILEVDLRDRLPALEFEEEFVDILANTPNEHREEVYAEAIRGILDVGKDSERP